MEKQRIKVLEQMLFRMEEGTLGCTGFNICETNSLDQAIKELKAAHKP